MPTRFTFNNKSSNEMTASDVITLFGVITFFLLMPLMLILRGYVIQYGWNNLLREPLHLPTMTILSAIAFSTLMATLSKQRNVARNEKETIWQAIGSTIFSNLFLLFFFWVLTWFK